MVGITVDDFTFLHAADLHLDSPLQGLSRRSQEHARRIADASRVAFDNLIGLAIGERCRFMLLAGDVFDGDWKDHRTGVMFAEQMRRLGAAGIDVYLVLGNHDAENKYVNRLTLSENVHIFGAKKPQSMDVANCSATVHGWSYAQRDVFDNLAGQYPAPRAGRFNIGLLHTACEGRQGHALYAPCTVEQLVNHGYAYWALGHVHAREELWPDPLIVYPGNLQGRNPRETGAKGATLVRVADNRIAQSEHRPLDVVRWARLDVDASSAQNRSDVLAVVGKALRTAFSGSDGRSLIVHVGLTGTTALHESLVAEREVIAEEVEMLAASVAEDLWVEKLEVCTSGPSADDGIDPSVAGRLKSALETEQSLRVAKAALKQVIDDVRPKFPASTHLEALVKDLEETATARGLGLAKAILKRASGATDAF